MYLKSALALGAAFAAITPATAAYDAFGEVQTYSTYVRATDIAANRVPSGQYTGVGALFTSTESTRTTQLGSFCTGSLISSNIVVTAAHCLGEAGDRPTGINFYLPEYRASPDLQIFAAADYLVHPEYNDEALHGYDIALVRLKTAPGSQYDRYELYDDGGALSELGEFATRIGLGTTGTGTTGTSNPIDGFKRYGYNSYDITWDDALDAYAKLFPDDGIYGHDGSGFDAFGAPVDSILAYDFDDGTRLHDVFGRYAGYTGATTLGVTDPNKNLLGDSSSSPGDSGGPTFIDGKLAAITSFGITGNLYEVGNCATPGSVDPSRSAASCTNSSFGDIGGDTRVASFLGFINDGIDGDSQFTAFVPEPATWAMMIGGFGFVGAAMRRGNRAKTALA